MTKALVVDNSLMVLKVMTDILDELGVTSKTAEDGLDALKILEDFQPDIMFLDLIMPTFDGDKLCRIIRKIKPLQHSFIVILSGIAAEQKIDCTRFGANLCIAKGPFAQMKKHIEKALEILATHGSAFSSKHILGLEDIYEREVTRELLFSKKHFEVTISHLDEGFLELNDTGRILYLNPAAARLLGAEETELLSRPLTSFFQPEIRATIKNALDSLQDQPAIIGDHPPLLHNSRNLLFHLLPVHEDERTAVIVIVHDVTARVRIEAELHQHQEFLEDLVANRTTELTRSKNSLALAQKIASLGNWELDIASGFMSLSEEMRRIFDQQNTKTILQLDEYLELTVDQDRRLIEDAIAQRLPFASDRRLALPSGEPRIIHEQTEVIRDAKGQPEKILGIVQDITARKQVEEALRENEAKYRQLFDENTDAILIFDAENCLIEEINPAAEELLGYPRRELLNMCAHELFADPKQRDEAITRLRQDAGHAAHLPEMLIRRQNDSLFSAEMLAGSFMSQKRRKIIASIRNIEQRKRLEQDLRQAHKMEAIGTLAGGIAHDFNNILTAIMAHAELALQRIHKDDPTTPGMREIIKASTRAKELVGQILTFSRISDHSKRPLEIYLIITEALKLIRATTPTSIEIRTKINRHSGATLADPVQIHQLVMNLCANAVDAMAGKGILDIILDRVTLTESDCTGHNDMSPGNYLRLIVRDTGHGMDETTQQRIFEPFFTTKGVGKGTGMGLSVVHGVVKSHNGFIDLKTAQGKGTEFTISFPATEKSTARQSVIATPLPEGSEKILLVDDELSILKSMQTFLTGLGYNIITCTNGKIGLRTFMADPDSFDLVVTDQTMPDLTGDELARQILTRRPDIPIILVTGYSEAIDEESAKEIGIREYVLKPFLPGQLARLIRKHLSS